MAFAKMQGSTCQTGTNKLTHIEGTPPIDFGYDLNANITSETGWTYIYDLSNQLVRVLAGGNQVGEYTFNGAGQRIKKVTQTETRIFHYDLLGHIIAETNQSGQMLTEYIYLGDQLLTMIKPGELAYYFHNDHLGTPQVLTNGAGSIAWKAVYTPFGEAVVLIATVENPFRFPGQYYDQETGLHYNYFRYYDPTTGRYITPDPIGLEGGINLFEYVGGNPINNKDPKGLFWPKNALECAVYLPICAYKATECKKKVKPCEDEDYDPFFQGESATQFKECYQKVPECQKALESCGTFSLDPKDPFWHIWDPLKSRKEF